jgi:hypothetical protein
MSSYGVRSYFLLEINFSIDYKPSDIKGDLWIYSF